MQISGEYPCRVLQALATSDLHGALIEHNNLGAQFSKTDLKRYTGAGAAFKEEHSPSLTGKGLMMVQAVFLIFGREIKNLQPIRGIKIVFLEEVVHSLNANG